MQNYSFDMKDPVYEIFGLKVSIHIHTMENTYSLSPEKTIVELNNQTITIACSQLSWAGQQQRANGKFSLSAFRNDRDQIEFQMSAEAEQKIISIKLMIRDLPPVSIYDADTGSDIPINVSESLVQASGQIFYYPYNAFKYNNNLKLPVFFLKNRESGNLLGVYSQDHKVRAKRFVVSEEVQGEYKGKCCLELIHEELAVNLDTKISIPKWIIGEQVNSESFRDEYLAFSESEKGIGLTRWEERNDFPDWLREISLVLNIHGMHWSGYIFNTYENMLEIIRYVSERLEGRHILAYLPGWEGRYYWQYGQYRPEPLLGGKEGFQKLCSEAKRLGVHLMPMFGSNIANLRMENFQEFGPNSFMKTAARTRYHVNEPDWDLSRGHDNGWQAFMNAGSPAWRKELVRQITNLKDTYQFDGVFLDLVHHWVNDPDHEVFEGMRSLKNDLTKNNPDLLVVGENWYEGLLSIFPLFQVRPYINQPAWVGRYARTMAHLLEAEPSRGSTGVHEKGYTNYERKPLSKEYIPTIAFVDGTLEKAKKEIDEVLKVSHQYIDKYFPSKQSV
ncbi:DUF6259 domain-containing protein [Neobacillus cucumis]|uniref:DUF6259 domain-containing protein n=1 Tax=Neobacillus cucumis TaxID=1740721 RepID=A0A2N5H6A3_9BACI|nr:DUF6259 domain-containing protein [Neobacillus cucumis]PLS01051.1 hypothetical protein CVD27_27035 [Neobacillus cucumis]